VIDDNSFVEGLLCYHQLFFYCHESSLHRVLTWFLLIVCFCFFFRLCLVVFSFALYFWWMGSIPDFYLGVFLLFQWVSHRTTFTASESQKKMFQKEWNTH
jgi:hypothetical protein